MRSLGHRSAGRTAVGLAGTALVAFGIVALASLSTGCQLLVDFNRALIEGGVDAEFFDAGQGDGAEGTDAGFDAPIVPDAVADVKFVDGSPVDASADAPHADATTKDAGSKDATVSDGG